MSETDSAQTMSSVGPVKAWRENLASGVRLAFFRRTAAYSFHVSAYQFVAIALSSLAVSCVCSFALAGFGGAFNLQALPSELFWVPLALLAGYFVARIMKDERFALLVPIALGSIGIVLTVAATLIWFAADHRWFKVPSVLGLSGVYQLVFAWWTLSAAVAVRRLTSPLPGQVASPVFVVAFVVMVPLYFLPSEPLWEAALYPDEATDQADGEQAAFSESALYAQPQLLRAAVQQLKPERVGVEDLYFVGFAPYASQDVFMKETLSIGKLLEERFDTGGRSISLISHPDLAEKMPIATLTSLRDVLQAVGKRINPDEDVVLLHLTSHGSETHELSVEFYPLELQAIRPGDLRAALDDAGIKWRIVVISACYSGGFIEALKDAHTLVVTASDAKHTSFGCGNAFDFTYFSRAYYDEALRKTFSFGKAFDLAKESIRLREQKEGLEPSNPQIYMGEAMKEKLSRLERRLSAGTADAK